ncbi:MAG: tripartite tricarboxylate transporter TctB family protein [Loktanella sp.]|nr:tripartite tricarboxylate transporter TctB family protein [Loktanella sp.]
MVNDDRADMIAGILIGVAGVAIAIYAAAQFPMGTLRRLGPGMFPVGLGVTLALLGLGLAVKSWRNLTLTAVEDRFRLKFEIKTGLLTIAGVVAFALLLRPLGLVPAIFAVVGISAFADDRNTPIAIAKLAVVSAVLATLIFKVGLSMNFSLVAWNWS